MQFCRKFISVWDLCVSIVLVNVYTWTGVAQTTSATSTRRAAVTWSVLAGSCVAPSRSSHRVHTSGCQVNCSFATYVWSVEGETRRLLAPGRYADSTITKHTNFWRVNFHCMFGNHVLSEMLNQTFSWPNLVCWCINGYGLICMDRVVHLFHVVWDCILSWACCLDLSLQSGMERLLGSIIKVMVLQLTLKGEGRLLMSDSPHPIRLEFQGCHLIPLSYFLFCLPSLLALSSLSLFC